MTEHTATPIGERNVLREVLEAVDRQAPHSPAAFDLDAITNPSRYSASVVDAAKERLIAALLAPDAESDILKAPWTPEQVEALDRRQERDDLHPYTCPRCSHSLEPNPGGWRCENQCGYIQDWCFRVDVASAGDAETVSVEQLLGPLRKLAAFEFDASRGDREAIAFQIAYGALLTVGDCRRARNLVEKIDAAWQVGAGE